MKQKYNFLPYKLTEEEIAIAPMGWTRTMSNYTNRRKKAIKEAKPGYNTLLATILVAIAKRDRDLINAANELVNGNIPRHMYLTLVGSALCDFGDEEGLKMLREAAELDSSHSMLLILAADTDDLDEKEDLAKRVLNENPKDSDALRHLAYAKYFKGEHQEAERLINEILLNEPDNIYALEDKGNIYFDKEEYDKALGQYSKVKLKPLPISLQFKICHCYYLLGMLKKAKKIAKKIQNKVPLAYDIGMSVEKANALLTEILNS